MRRRWLILFMVLGAVLLLLGACNIRVTETAPAVPTSGGPAATAVPTAPPSQPPVSLGPQTPQPTQKPPTELAERPEMTVLGTLEGNIPHGITAMGNYFKGDPQAPLIIFEFSEYQCPYCAKYVRETLPQIVETYIATGKVVYIFWNRPLPPSMHPQAEISGEAAECAGKQGKYWEMHDLIFDKQSEWSGKADALSILLGYGVTVGLDQTAYQSCLSAHEPAEEIAQQAAFADGLGITGTPFFVFNSGGKLYALNGAQPFTTFQQAIDTLLQGQP